jgi:alcohol dehydrogenase
MKAALFHAGRPSLSVEDIPDPVLLPASAVVEVLACFVSRSIAETIEAPAGRMLPPFPFVPGMDTVGRVVAVADDVVGLRPGDLVYCDHWYQSHTKSGVPDHCFLGRYGMGPGARRHLERWRNGGFAEQIMLPAECMTPLGDAAARATPAQLCRLGWFGTAYGAFVKAGLKPSDAVIVVGASGMVGSSGILIALAMGAARIVALGRNREKLDTIARLSPRIVPLSPAGTSFDVAAIRAATGGRGADVVLDAVGNGAAPDATIAAIGALAFGGRAVLVGVGLSGPLALDYTQIMYNEIAVQGSLWFPRRAAGEMIAMIAAGTLDLSAIQPETVDLDHVNDGVRAAARESMGLRHWAVCPRRG